MQTTVREISPPEADQQRAAGATLIDVREQVEWDAGHIAGALFIPRGVLGQEIEAAVPDHDTPIVVYCRSGARSALGTQLLQQLGYTDVVNMAGGILTSPPRASARSASSTSMSSRPATSSARSSIRPPGSARRRSNPPGCRSRPSTPT